jgi:hypothetical protein
MDATKMRLSLKTLTMLLLVALLPGAAGAASFTASLDRDSMMLGEQATLSLKFEGVQPQDAPGMPNIAGLQFQYVGPSSSFSFINGQTTSSVTYNYLVTAQRTGDFTIPAMRADIGSQQLASAPLKLTVNTANAPSAAAVNSGSEIAFLKFTFPKNKIYVGEAEVGRLELYLRDDVQNFGNFQITSSPTDGFNAGKTTELQNQRRRVQVGNRVYTEIPLALPLTAIRAGALTLGPFTASAVVVLPSQNQGGDPFFRQFFNQGEQQQINLATEALNIQSLPLPAQNRPANFSGAVGQFSFTASAGPTTVTVGDPITVRVQVSGRGALDGVTLPAQNAWQNFKTYPPTTKLDTADPFGFQGTKTFEQIISPENSDVHELPALTFSFFNPDDGQYHTLTQAAVPLTVKAAGTSPMPVLAANKNSADEKPAQDILPIKENLGALSQNKTPLVAQPAFLAVQSMPVLAFLAAFIWRQRTDNLANNPRLRRQRAVAQLVRDGLNDLKKFAAENKADEFFALLFRLLQEQLGERLDCPATAITENVIEEHAVLRSAPNATRDTLRELFQLCNQARYAPVRGTGELNSVAAKFETTVGALQEVKA